MATPVIENFFLCIGAQKSGTTWLARMLQTHPELFLTPVKEIHYFDHVQGITEHLSNKKRRSRYRKYHQRMWTQWGHFSEYRRQWAWYRDYMASPVDDDWYRQLTVTGRARVLRPDPDLADLDAISRRYRGTPYERRDFAEKNLG